MLVLCTLVPLVVITTHHIYKDQQSLKFNPINTIILYFCRMIRYASIMGKSSHSTTVCIIATKFCQYILSCTFQIAAIFLDMSSYNTMKSCTLA